MNVTNSVNAPFYTVNFKLEEQTHFKIPLPLFWCSSAGYGYSPEFHINLELSLKEVRPHDGLKNVGTMEGGNEAVKDRDKEKRNREKSENQTAGGWCAPAALPTSFFLFILSSLSFSFSLSSLRLWHDQDAVLCGSPASMCVSAWVSVNTCGRAWNGNQCANARKADKTQAPGLSRVHPANTHKHMHTHSHTLENLSLIYCRWCFSTTAADEFNFVPNQLCRVFQYVAKGLHWAICCATAVYFV